MKPNLRKLEACIFDLDGVLVDTAKYHFLSWQSIAHNLGIDFTLSHNENLKGVSRKESLEYILQLGSVEVVEEEKIQLMDTKNKLYLNFISSLSPSDLLSGVIPFLDSLKNNRIKIALGSASKNALPVLYSTGIFHYFDTISDGNSTNKSKPDPDVFLIASRALGVDPSNCIVFEDAQKGVEAAKSGGFYCIGIGEEPLFGVDHALDDFSNIFFYDIEEFYFSFIKS